MIAVRIVYYYYINLKKHCTQCTHILLKIAYSGYRIRAFNYHHLRFVSANDAKSLYNLFGLTIPKR